MEESEKADFCGAKPEYPERSLDITAASAGYMRDKNMIKGAKYMQMKRMKHALSCILCTVLIVAMALITTACSGKAKETTEAIQTVTIADGDVLGSGETSFQFTVVDQEGTSVTCQIHTDKEIVGEALQELGLLAGEEGPYGLYVKTVNGITVDYDKDGKYWAFYIGDEYASSGVDKTEITAGESYALKVE